MSSRYISLATQVDDVVNELMGAEDRITELEKFIYDISDGGLVRKVDKLGTEVSRELGYRSPGLWAIESHPILEMLQDFRKEIVEVCRSCSQELDHNQN